MYAASVMQPRLNNIIVRNLVTEIFKSFVRVAEKDHGKVLIIKTIKINFWGIIISALLVNE